jgi:hypothetical protein
LNTARQHTWRFTNKSTITLRAFAANDSIATMLTPGIYWLGL